MNTTSQEIIVPQNVLSSSPAPATYARRLRFGAADLAGVLLLWQSRASERRHLESLDDRLLTDQRLSRADAAREARKPFWRA